MRIGSHLDYFQELECTTRMIGELLLLFSLHCRTCQDSISLKAHVHNLLTSSYFIAEAVGLVHDKTCDDYREFLSLEVVLLYRTRHAITI